MAAAAASILLPACLGTGCLPCASGGLQASWMQAATEGKAAGLIRSSCQDILPVTTAAVCLRVLHQHCSALAAACFSTGTLCPAPCVCPPAALPACLPSLLYLSCRCPSASASSATPRACTKRRARARSRASPVSDALMCCVYVTADSWQKCLFCQSCFTHMRSSG